MQGYPRSKNSVWNNVKLNQPTCERCVKELIFNGHMFSADVIAADPSKVSLDSKVHGANMGPIWGRQDPCGPHVDPMNLVIWVCYRWHAWADKHHRIISQSGQPVGCDHSYPSGDWFASSQCAPEIRCWMHLGCTQGVPGDEWPGDECISFLRAFTWDDHHNWSRWLQAGSGSVTVGAVYDGDGKLKHVPYASHPLTESEQRYVDIERSV